MKDQIVVVLDRSGSMTTIQSDMEGGLNEFIQEQRTVNPEAEVTLVKFDNEYEMVYDRAPIGMVTGIRLQPRGTTALHDAIGKTISYLRERVYCRYCSRHGEKPKVVFAIITDGLENASTEYNGTAVKALIEDMRKEHDWQFVFLGANQDAIQTGSTYGIGANASITYTANADGVRGVTRAFSHATTCYMSDLTSSVSFNQDDREQSVNDEPSNRTIVESSSSA